MLVTRNDPLNRIKLNDKKVYYSGGKHTEIEAVYISKDKKVIKVSPETVKNAKTGLYVVFTPKRYFWLNLD